MSSIPASRATSINASSSISAVFSMMISPFLPNMYETDPETPRFPPFLSKAVFTDAAVLFLLSVSASTIIATPPGPYPS